MHFLNLYNIYIREKNNLYLDKLENDNITKVISNDYTTNGEYLLVVTKKSTITLNSLKDTKIKIKSLSESTIISDKGLIDNKWESVELDGDSCAEFVFIKIFRLLDYC